MVGKCNLRCVKMRMGSGPWGSQTFTFDSQVLLGVAEEQRVKLGEALDSPSVGDCPWLN